MLSWESLILFLRSFVLIQKNQKIKEKRTPPAVFPRNRTIVPLIKL